MITKTVLTFAAVVASASLAVSHPAGVGLAPPAAAPEMTPAAQPAPPPAQPAPAVPTPVQPATPMPMEPTAPMPAAPIAPAAPAQGIMNSGYISGYYPGSFVSGVEGRRHMVGLFEPTANIRSPGRIYLADRSVVAPERVINPRVLSPGSAHRAQHVDEGLAMTRPRIRLDVMPPFEPEMFYRPMHRHYRRRGELMMMPHGSMMPGMRMMPGIVMDPYHRRMRMH